MKKNILYIERKFQGFYSLEKVFRQIAKKLPAEDFETSFQQVNHPAGFSGIIRNLLSFKPRDADVYHVTGDITYIALVLPPERTILTIPDLSILRYRKGVRRFVLKKLLFDWPIRRSRYITAISQATADAIVSETGCDASKISTIGLPVDENPVEDEKRSFNGANPTILQVGTLRYKNLPNLIRAIEGLRCRLTLIGKLDGTTRELLRQKKIDYVNESMIDDEAIREHYRKADIVAFCSVFEGFGLPIIEAQAMRTPVITSDLEPMKSVAGDGAILVDPNDPKSIREGLDVLIADDSLRKNLVEKGTRNVERFRPAAISAQYADLYAQVIAESQNRPTDVSRGIPTFL